MPILAHLYHRKHPNSAAYLCRLSLSSWLENSAADVRLNPVKSRAGVITWAVSYRAFPFGIGITFPPSYFGQAGST